MGTFNKQKKKGKKKYPSSAGSSSNSPDKVKLALAKEQKLLKLRLDELWSKSPESARPILNDMQKLIAITEEYNSIEKNLTSMAKVVASLKDDRQHLVKCIMCFLQSANEWNELKPKSLSENLLLFIENNIPDSKISDALSFEPDNIMNLLINTGAQIDEIIKGTIQAAKDKNNVIQSEEKRHKSTHEEKRHKSTHKDKLDSSIKDVRNNGIYLQSDSNKALDDSEYIRFAEQNVNEITFTDVFEKKD